MKNLILATAVLSFTCMVNAQTNRSTTASGHQKHQRKNLSPDERSKQEADKAQSDLGLSAEQKAKWEAASLERIKANEPLKEKMHGSTTPDEREQLRKQVRSNGDKFDGSVIGFLTAEQKAKFDEIKKARREKRGRAVRATPSQN